MKIILFCLAMMIVFSPLVYAASDCEHTCCRTYNGNWDDDFDDCGGSPGEGFEMCVSDCEAAVWNSMPQGPGPASPENTYHYECCASAFLLGTALLGSALCKENPL